MELLPEIVVILQPLLEKLPPDQAMAELVVPLAGSGEGVDWVRELTGHAHIAARPALIAGLWLYVDELGRSHKVSQGIDDTTGSYWHGIMHRREGDFSNSHYWLRQTGVHPAMRDMPGVYHPHDLVDDVAHAHAHGEQMPALVDLQRAEWAALFNWCWLNR